MRVFSTGVPFLFFAPTHCLSVCFAISARFCNWLVEESFACLCVCVCFAAFAITLMFPRVSSIYYYMCVVCVCDFRIRHGAALFAPLIMRTASREYIYIFFARKTRFRLYIHTVFILETA